MPFDFESDFSHHDRPIDVQHLRQLFFTAIVEAPLEFFSFHHMPVFVGTLFLKAALLVRSYFQLRNERRSADATNIDSKALEFNAINNLYDRGINTAALAVCAGMLHNAIIPYFLLRTITMLCSKLKTNRDIAQQEYLIYHDKLHGDDEKKAIILHAASTISPAFLRALKLSNRAPKKPVIIIDGSSMETSDHAALAKNTSLLRTLYRNLYARSEVHFCLPYLKGAEKPSQTSDILDTATLKQLLLPNYEAEVVTDDIKEHYYVDWTSEGSHPKDFLNKRWDDDEELDAQKLFNRENLRIHTLRQEKVVSKMWQNNQQIRPHVNIHTHDLAKIYSLEFGEQCDVLFQLALSLADPVKWQAITGESQVPKVILDIQKTINGKDSHYFLKLCEIQRLCLKERQAYWRSNAKYQVFDTLSKIFPREQHALDKTKPVSIDKTIADMITLISQAAPQAAQEHTPA